MRFLFKVPRYKRFDFKPRYYDASHEALQMRIRAHKREQGDDEGHDPDALRGKMNHAWRASTARSASKRSNRNILVIAGLLLVIAYLVLFT